MHELNEKIYLDNCAYSLVRAEKLFSEDGFQKGSGYRYSKILESGLYWRHASLMLPVLHNLRIFR